MLAGARPLQFDPLYSKIMIFKPENDAKAPSCTQTCHSLCPRAFLVLPDDPGA